MLSNLYAALSRSLKEWILSFTLRLIVCLFTKAILNIRNKEITLTPLKPDLLI